MILVPVCGYQSSGRTTLLQQFVGSYAGATVYKDSDGRYEAHGITVGKIKISVITQAVSYLKLIRLIHKFGSIYKYHVILFENNFTLKDWQKLNTVFHHPDWLVAVMKTSRNECANRLVLDSQKKPFATHKFIEQCRKLDSDLKTVREVHQVLVCELSPALHPTALSAKLMRAIETTFKLERSTSEGE